MKSKIIVLFMLFLLMFFSACTKEMTDEEILKRAEEIIAAQEAESQSQKETQKTIESEVPQNSVVTEDEAPQVSTKINAKDNVLSTLLSQSYYPFYDLDALKTDQLLLDRIDIYVLEDGTGWCEAKYLSEFESTFSFIDWAIAAFDLENIDIETVQKQIEAGRPFHFGITGSATTTPITVYLNDSGDGNDFLFLESPADANKLAEYIDLCFNQAVFQDSESQLIFNNRSPMSQRFSILVNDNYMFSQIRYCMSDSFLGYSGHYTSADFTSQVSRQTSKVPEKYTDSGDTIIEFSQNMINCAVALSPDDKTIQFSQSTNGFDQFISEYLDPEFTEGSLLSLGFIPNDNEPERYVYQTKNVEISIFRASEGADEDMLELKWSSSPYGNLSVLYDSNDNSYAIYLEKNNKNFSVSINEAGIIYPTNPYIDLYFAYGDVYQLTKMGTLDSAETLRDLCNNFIIDTLGVSIETLANASVR